MELIAVASLNSVEDQTSNPVEFNTSEPFVNTEFEWTMGRQDFQAMRSRKVLLKVHFFVTYMKSTERHSANNQMERKLIGSVSFDLRETKPLTVSKESNQGNSTEHDVSYVIHSNWKTFESEACRRHPDNIPIYRCLMKVVSMRAPLIRTCWKLKGPI